MEDPIKQLWQCAVTERAKNSAQPIFTQKEKIRLEHELDIIKQTNTAEQILSFIAQADEAHKKGKFYVKGAANCSFLLYSVGATTINPLGTDSPFERFINPLMDGLPYYEIVFSNPHQLTLDEQTLSLNKFILKRAIDKNFIKEKQLEFNKVWISADYANVNNVLSETNGNIIWQEQVIELLHRIGGFSYAEADLMRRECGKAYLFKGIECTEIKKMQNRFVRNAVSNNKYDENHALALFDYIVRANADAFIKASLAAIVLGSN